MVSSLKYTCRTRESEAVGVQTEGLPTPEAQVLWGKENATRVAKTGSRLSVGPSVRVPVPWLMVKANEPLVVRRSFVCVSSYIKQLCESGVRNCNLNCVNCPAMGDPSGFKIRP